MGTAWLRCEIKPSTLQGEVAVLVETVDGLILSFFLPADLVKHRSKNLAEGEISVEVVDKNAEQGVVFLPRRSFEGTNVAKVSSGALTFA